MKLEKAIEIKEQGQHWLPKESFPELLEADRLSIEALKRIKKERLLGNIHPNDNLKGETME